MKQSKKKKIRTAALVNVKSFLDKFKDPERVEEYVRSSLLYHREIPFLYRVFKPSLILAFFHFFSLFFEK